MAPNSARITLSFGRDSEGPRRVGYFNMLGLSFTLYQIWLYMAVFSAPKTFDASSFSIPTAISALSHHAVLVYVFLGMSALLLVLFGILHQRLTTFFESRRSVIIAGTCGIAGTVLLQLGVGATLGGVVVAAASMGACASLFVILLGNAFAKFDFITCILDSAVSVALGFIGAVALVNWIPSPISGIMATLMPILMTIVFWKQTPSLSRGADPAASSSHMRRYLQRFGVSMALFGFVIGALRVVCADRLLSSGSLAIELVIGVASIVGVVLFVFAIVMSKRDAQWDSLFRTIVPVVALGIAFMVGLPADSTAPISSFFVTLGFVGIAALVWIFLASLSRNLNGASVLTYGLGYGIMQGASALGSLLANWLVSSDGEFAIWLLAIGNGMDVSTLNEGRIMATLCIALLAVVLGVALSFAQSAHPRYRELKRIMSSVLTGLMRSRTAAEAVPEGAADGAEPALEDAGEYEGADAAATDDEPSEDGSASQEAPAGADGEPQQPPREEKGSFVRRCEQLSRQYGLSARESEVFFLLAKGHNAAYITDKLCVSRSTTKTHINHIYKKMDIHTQQELLTMVEDRTRGPVAAEIDRDAIRQALERDPSQVVESIHRDYIGF